MSVVERPTDEECYLYALLSDESGLDQAEFSWKDAEHDNMCFRGWDFQWGWWRDNSPLVIDQCFPGDSLVLTKRGNIPIKDIVIGDEVLTHKNRWKPVTWIFDQGEQELVEINGHGHWGMLTTPEHEFYLKDGFAVPRVGDMWSSPNVFPDSKVPELPEMLRKNSRQNMPSDVNSLDFLWLYGLYLAEESCSSSFGKGGTVNRITFSVHTKEVSYVESYLDSVGLRYNTQRIKGEECFNIVVNSRVTAEWMIAAGGRGSRNKFLAAWALGLSKEQRTSILEGAAYGDGYQRNKDRTEYSTTSRKLAVGMKLLAQSLGYSVTINRNTKKDSYIDGRRIKGGEYYVTTWSYSGRSIMEDGFCRSKVYNVEETYIVERCYDIEVEDDSSYVVEGIVVHNCGRSVGKSLSIRVRAYAFPFIHPGQEMVITAPEGNHLDAVTDVIETAFLDNRLGKEMLRDTRGSGIKHRPFHCIGEGQLVLTSVGYKPIEEIAVGDMVWTHKDRWKSVLKVHDNGVRDVVSLSGTGHHGLELTDNHRLYAAKTKQITRYKDDTKTSRTTTRRMLPPEWIPVRDWRLKDSAYRWCSNVTIDNITKMPEPTLRLNNRGFGVGKGNLINVYSEDFMWFVGHYLAEGCVWRENLLDSTVHEDEVSEVCRRYRAAGLDCAMSKPREIDGKGRHIRIYNEPLISWIKEFAPGDCYTKEIKPWVFGLEAGLRKALLNGYLYGDGHLTPRGDQHPRTSSRKLAYSLKMLCTSLGYGVGVYECPPKDSFIKGRPVHSRVNWELHINFSDPSNLAHVHSVFEDKKVWSAATKIKAVGPKRVFDLTVEDDNSYVVEGIFVHNCNFANGARIMGRIPQRDGRGIKGCAHVLTPIPTRKGLKLAQDVEVGDEVISAKGEWNRVTQVIHDINDCYEVEGVASFPLVVSCDHRFLGAGKLSTSKQKKKFGDVNYYDVTELMEDNVHWASPRSFPKTTVDYPVFPSGNVIDSHTPDFWFLVGLYIADGYLRKSNSTKEDTCVNWISHPQNKGRKKLIRALEHLGCTYRITKRAHSSGDKIETASVHLAKWLNENIGRTAISKTMPVSFLSLPDEYKEALLDGYLTGDGHWNEPKARWDCSSASKSLMTMIQLLSQSLGFQVTCSSVQPKVTHVMGVELKKKPEMSWRLFISEPRNTFVTNKDDYLLGRVKSITPMGKQPIVNITVDGDHSYLTGTIMSHNIHPVWLELDEAQDYPDKGWIEIFETVKHGTQGAMWRAHGVTRGIRDYFYKFTQDDSGWKVNRYSAMHRPTWTPEEREAKIAHYGSRDHPDYRRNVLGLHGDATNPIFVLNRLMSCWASGTSIKTFNENGGHDDVMIQHIKVGDVVETASGAGTVTNVIPSEHDTMLELVVDGEVFYCTPDHRILTFEGWKEAQHLTKDDEIVRYDSIVPNLRDCIDWPR